MLNTALASTHLVVFYARALDPRTSGSSLARQKRNAPHHAQVFATESKSTEALVSATPDIQAMTTRTSIDPTAQELVVSGPPWGGRIGEKERVKNGYKVVMMELGGALTIQNIFHATTFCILVKKSLLDGGERMY